jgi:uncharacterized protein (DUF2249 family)
MVKVFILSFSDEAAEQDVLNYLDRRREVLNWLSVLPNNVFIVSDHNAETLTNLLARKFPDTFFVVSEYSARKANGMLTDEAWDFLNNPKPA